MPYVPEDDLKRMSKMLMNQAEIFASNYCFAWKHDDPGDVEDVTAKVLEYFGKAVVECVQSSESRV